MVSTRLMSMAALVAYASTCAAEVSTSIPVASTRWVIGEPAEIRWRLSSPISKEDTATIYLVGGDYTAYTRLETLVKSIRLGEHKLKIPKVPNVQCGGSCAIEFLLDRNITPRDFYSHNFTISATATTTTTASTVPVTSATSGIVADKSAPVPVPRGNGATPNGPITLVQNAAKGAQSENQTSSSPNTFATSGTIAAGLVMTALSMTWLL
ncbi:hypothetical protein BG004_003949 [Podila humilis]|nr:hypothetical protein BG004_003949 [Podila humilis]